MCGAWFALASCALVQVAHAALHRTGVAIVFSDGFEDRQGVVSDLASEFRAEGFDVRLIGEERDDASLDDWAARAREDGDRALIHVVPGGAGDAVIEVLLVRPENLVFKDTIRRQASDASDIAAVRAVEVTRAALIEVHQAPPLPTTDQDIVRDDPYAARASARPPFIAASVSPVLVITGSSMLSFLDLGVNVSWLSSEHIALEFEGAFPLGQQSESSSEGTVVVHAAYVHMGASVFLTDQENWFRPYLAARTGALFLSMQPVATALFAGTSETSISFLNTIAAGASLRVYGAMRLRAEASVGVSAAPPLVSINSRWLDRLGLPITLLRIGPEVMW